MDIQSYQLALREVGCMVSGRLPVSLHHAVGGSIARKLGPRGSKKHSDWLQIPLHYDFHQGRHGIHTIGVKTWESDFGTQVDLINMLCRRFNLDLWALAEQSERRPAKRSGKILAHPGYL